MAAAFRPVNIEVKKEDSTMTTSPTTPTPTKATFGQRPLPSSPFPQAVQIPDNIDEKKGPRRESSQISRKSRDSNMDVDDTDGEGHGEDGSEDESIDGSKSSKKNKKSQRFYCTDYPPCNLSFTRSEHLARHIRKHTGERPFICFCQRKFSRLDNLRQHAQTVHVNEDIPPESLAATGTRFQRQIRTERVRQPGRARASTAGSVGAARGHSKSLSTSSITSIGSNFGNNREEVRTRRPPPLVMATDQRSRLSFESYHSGADSQFPSDFSTPTSATFSTAQSSPRWSGSVIASPTSSHSRSQSMYTGSRTPGRRLSVPSGNPFSSPIGASLGRPLFGPGANSSNQGSFSPTLSVTSPTSSVFSRRESNSAEEAWRRRTWHPDSSNNFQATSSRLSNVITPSQFSNSVPIANPAAQSTTVRLPGIESFDPVPHRPSSPPRRIPSPMHLDTLAPVVESRTEERRGSTNWDVSLHRGLTRLDISTSNTTPPRDGAGSWAHEVNQLVEAEADRVRLNPPMVRFNDNIIIERSNPSMTIENKSFHQHTMSAPSITGKRHGWYNGPVTVHTDAPPEKMARVERMVHPNIGEFAGFPARQNVSPQQPPRSDNATDRDNMLRLQALVAVATSENSATAAY
ncbi:uncharacterized protein BCR38DRAFT_152522 [Pseudomassariella vexata]|uniref:C2H2-type domain-containing protein n=1 Tax=Pseudomassariella vexata TaxID=1141098 RepID=A0A1Y2E6I8_9PEZI|nr:uncharacterized protein BCR38DRAFT_152522 [Pseudomassariella vexata]ORY67178.1 hypothetical protein BCR38DRAFT_152522 [Pseudomassariella vexata]